MLHRLAHAALAELRQPAPAMLAAGRCSLPRWRAAIDAGLGK